MQLYALDKTGRYVFAKEALKQTDYYCPECSACLRLRGGLHRQNHFYHIDTTHACQLNGKSLEHINVQLHFYETLPQGECVLEKRFDEIGRIADVVWSREKIVFEIQCSPLSHSEALARNCDYKRLGYDVVWILHDKRYNQKRLSALEYMLHGMPHYFSNINSEGVGTIYDQFSLLEGGCRYALSKPFPIDIQSPGRIATKGVQARKKVFSLAELRMQKSALYFARDLVDYYLHYDFEGHEEICKALKAEEKYAPLSQTSDNKILNFITKYFVRPYKLFVQILLERACR